MRKRKKPERDISLSNYFEEIGQTHTRLVLDRFQDSSKTGSGINFFATFFATFLPPFFALLFGTLF